MARHLHGTIAERSRSQLGLITHDQILELGFTPRQVRHAISAGTLERVEPGVLRIAGSPITWEQKLHAGLLGLGPASLVSHIAAAAIWPTRRCPTR